MRVHLTTLGCRLNEAELESWSRGFQALGHEITGELATSDLVVVNTCAVTAEAVRKSRRLIRRAQRDNPRAKLVISGCLASLNNTGPIEALGADLVVNNRDKDRLVEISTQELDLHTMSELATEPGESPLLARGRQRAFVKIQDGCRYRCSFCVVTLARGEERSRPVAELVDEIRHLPAEGIQEVLLTGVHIAGYGADIGSSLYQLIDRLLTDTDIPRIRLGSLEPWDLPDNFWTLFRNPRLMPHLHLPLQSGSDAVLRRMSRRCSTAEFARLVKQARTEVADLNVTTDIIVGFPGETEQEWRQTMAFVEHIGFGDLHIFAYSPRPGTKAAELPDQVDAQTKKARSQQLHLLSERLKRTNLQAYLGREFEVLIEGLPQLNPDGTRTWGGYTPNFLRVALNAPPTWMLENTLCHLRLETLEKFGDRIATRLIA